MWLNTLRKWLVVAKASRGRGRSSESDHGEMEEGRNECAVEWC